jgi:hypothetical protein
VGCKIGDSEDGRVDKIKELLRGEKFIEDVSGKSGYVSIGCELGTWFYFFKIMLGVSN